MEQEPAKYEGQRVKFEQKSLKEHNYNMSGENSSGSCLGYGGWSFGTSSSGFGDGSGLILRQKLNFVFFNNITNKGTYTGKNIKSLTLKFFQSEVSRPGRSARNDPQKIQLYHIDPKFSGELVFLIIFDLGCSEKNRNPKNPINDPKFAVKRLAGGQKSVFRSKFLKISKIYGILPLKTVFPTKLFPGPHMAIFSA